MLPRLALGAGLLFQTACSTLPSGTETGRPALTEGAPPCMGDPTCRPLTKGEIKLARTVFGDAINYKTVRVFFHPYSVKRLGAPATAVDGNVSIHKPHMWSNDYSEAVHDLRKTYVHEMTHVWQHQNGQDLALATATLILKRPFNYNANYAYTLDNRPFREYSHEQQARIIEDFFDAVTSIDTIRNAPEKSEPATIIVQCNQIANLQKVIEPVLSQPAQNYCKKFIAPAPLSLNGR